MTIYPDSASFVVAIGDSHTNFGVETGCTYAADGQWCAQLGFALAGLAISTILSVANGGANCTLDRDAGAAFQPGTTFRLEAAGVVVWQAMQPKYSGPTYVVTAQAGDVLTVSPPLPKGLPAGTQIVGLGGGKSALVKNVGHSGYTTAQMFGVLPQCFLDGDKAIAPKLAIFGHATNDWNAQGATTVKTTGGVSGGAVTLPVQTGAAAALAVAGACLTVNGVAGYLVRSVSGDTITATPPAGTAASAWAAGTTVAIDTQNNLIAIGQYLLNRGVPKIAIVSQKLDNIAGADWTGSAVAMASWKATLKTYQLAAQTALQTQYGVTIPYLDLFAGMQARIAAGRDVGGSACYEIYATNTHPGAYGGQAMGLLAMAQLAASGALAAL